MTDLRSGGQKPPEAHSLIAPATQSPATGLGDGQTSIDAHRNSAVAVIIELWRQREDLRRAETRLNLQCQAICRRVCAGDAASARLVWREIRAGRGDNGDLGLVLLPYLGGMAALDRPAQALERQLARLARATPLWAEWGAEVRGLGELSLAGLIGEARATPGAYRSVSALWKRFGLAVIDGERQRRISDAQAAVAHGFSPRRRAFAYVLSTNLLRSQRDGDPFRALYDDRKAYELGRGLPKAHAHNRALRHIGKDLIRRAWVADRRAA